MGQTQRYRVDTDKGSYEVEVEDQQAGPDPNRISVMEQGQRSVNQNDVPEGEKPSSLMGMLQGPAHPKSMGDFLSLIIPSEIGEAGPSIMRMIKAGANEARTGGTGAVATAKNMLKGAKDYAFPSNPVAKFTGPGGFSRYATAPKPAAGNFGAVASEASSEIGQAGVNELPTYLQQQLMEQMGHAPSAASGSSRVGMPPAREPMPGPVAAEVPRQMPPLTVKGAGGHMPELAPSATPTPEVPRQMPPLTSGSRGGTMPNLVPSQAQAGRLAGKAPTLEEELVKALTEGGAADKPRMSTGAPDTTITPGGPTRQSGSFPKSEQVGKPGGYSSGRPASKALKDVIERRQNTQGPPPGMSERRQQELLDKFGGRQATPDPAKVAELRRMHGARDAAKMLGITEDEVRRLAPGPSRTPLVAEERIRDAANKARSGE